MQVLIKGKKYHARRYIEPVKYKELEGKEFKVRTYVYESLLHYVLGIASPSLTCLYRIENRE